MRPFAPARSAWRNALFVILMGVLWILFAPRQLGGQVSYVIVNGISMWPRFHKGDFVLVRQAPEYPVGAIVTYRYPGIGPVIHRVVGRSGAKYVMKGDNNTWKDAYEPAADEILGAYWMEVPGVGDWIVRLRSPLWFSLLTGMCTLLVGLSMQTNPQPQKALRRQAGDAAARLNRWAATWRDGAYTLALIVGLAGCLLLIFGWTRPITRVSTVEVPLTQKGVYAYAAAVPPGIYDQNRVESGGAIFPQISCLAQMRFDYTLAAENAAGLSGTHHLIAEVSSSKGWKRTIALEKETPFSGPQADAIGTLDFCAAQAMIAEMQRATGVQEMQYQLALYPQVQVKGRLGLFAFTDQFNEPLVFVMEPHQAYLLPESAGKNPLEPVKSGLVAGQLIADNTLPVLSLALPVRLARIIGVAALLLAGLGLLWVETAARQAEARDPRQKIARLLGRPPVPVSARAFDGRAPIPLATLDGLIALAQQLGAPVLYAKYSGGTDSEGAEYSGAENGGETPCALSFLVEAGDAVYCYAVEGAAV